MSKPSALEEQMRADREKLINERASHIADIEAIESRLAMLDAYLCIEHHSTVWATAPVEVQRPAPREKRKYTRKTKTMAENNPQDDRPPAKTGYCSQCEKIVSVDSAMVKGQIVVKCHECGGLQVENLK
jgi:RNase P subunit RPR2